MMRPVVFITFAALFQATWGSAKDVRGAENNVGVVGGNRIPIEEAPWMALVHTSEDVPCAGTIVDKRFILTVANCCSNNGKPRSQWIARVGTDGSTQGRIVKIQNDYKYNHTGQDFNLRPTLCLLKLERALIYTREVQRALLDEPDAPNKNGALVDFTAFGRPSWLDKSYGLRRAKLPIRDDEVCKKDAKRLYDGQFCAGDNDHNACAGDAGGALTAGKYLIGVLSKASCNNNPSRFSKISQYRPWITNTIAKNL